MATKGCRGTRSVHELDNAFDVYGIKIVANNGVSVGHLPPET